MSRRSSEEEKKKVRSFRCTDPLYTFAMSYAKDNDMTFSQLVTGMLQQLQSEEAESSARV